jgi:hypothetical protein
MGSLGCTFVIDKGEIRMGFRFSVRKWIHLQCFTKEVLSEKAISEIQPEVIGGFRDLKAVDQEEVLEKVKSAKIKIRNRRHAKAGNTKLYLSEDEGDKADDSDVVEDSTDLLKSIDEKCDDHVLSDYKLIELDLVLQLRYKSFVSRRPRREGWAS